MSFVPLSSQYFVSAQLHIADLKIARDQGITQIICNRPDFEAPGQPLAAEIEAAANDIGLSFSLLPISQGIGTELMDGLQAALSEQSLILAYCKLGTRSALLWVATLIRDGADPDETLKTAQAAGYDFAAFRDGLTALARPSGEQK